MRITDFTGIYHMHEGISIEADRAQRMAELEQIARYRSVRLAQYKAWADDQQRMQIQINSKVELAKAMAEVEGKTVWLRPLAKLEDRIGMTMIVKPEDHKWSWISRLYARIFHR